MPSNFERLIEELDRVQAENEARARRAALADFVDAFSPAAQRARRARAEAGRMMMAKALTELTDMHKDMQSEAADPEPDFEDQRREIRAARELLRRRISEGRLTGEEAAKAESVINREEQRLRATTRENANPEAVMHKALAGFGGVAGVRAALLQAAKNGVDPIQIAKTEAMLHARRYL